MSTNNLSKRLIFRMQGDDAPLGFTAILDSDEPEDENRQFVISYYLDDHSIAIVEQGNQKLGIQARRFLKRMKIDDPKIMAIGRIFELVSASEYTLCIMESHSSQFPQSDLGEVVQSLGGLVKDHGIDLSIEFARNDSQKTNFVTKKEAETILGSVPDFSKQQIITVIRRFTKGEKFEYDDLLKYIND